jgi:hypothetical protein
MGDAAKGKEGPKMNTEARNLAKRLRRAAAKERQLTADKALWLAVAEAAQKGMVTCPEAPTLDAALYELTCGCAKVEHSLDDDLRASMALSESGL